MRCGYTIDQFFELDTKAAKQAYKLVELYTLFKALEIKERKALTKDILDNPFFAGLGAGLLSFTPDDLLKPSDDTQTAKPIG